MRRRFLVLLAAGVTASTAGCGVPDADGQWAREVSRTCASIIARAGLPAPEPDAIDPQRFLDERQALLASGEQFNTVTPFKRVCNRVKQQLQEAESEEMINSDLLDAVLDVLDQDSSTP